MRFSVGYYFHYRKHFCDPVQTVFKLIDLYPSFHAVRYDLYPDYIHR